MSVTDPQADPVQPEGQGDAGTGTPYDEYLSRIPEEVRDDVEPVFKDWDANVTRRFQDAAEYKKGWEPYEQAGVQQHSPEAIEWALQFYQAAQNDPQSIQQWFDAYAKERGLTPAQAAEQIQQQDEFGQFDPSQQFEEQLKQRLSPVEQQLQEFAQWREQQDMNTRITQAKQYIDGQMAELEEKHGTEFNREAVEMFVPNFIESDPEHAVPRAYEAYQSMRNQIEKSALQGKVDAPSPAEGGGVPDGSPEALHTFKQAEAVAAEFLRNSNRA